MSVPYPVGVKNAGIPAPPARILSANVPCKSQFTFSDITVEHIRCLIDDNLNFTKILLFVP